MSYRNLFFEYKKSSRDLNHRFRKFQMSKLPTYVQGSKPKTKIIEIEVPIDDSQD